VVGRLPVEPELLVHVAERLRGGQAHQQVGALLHAGQHPHPPVPEQTTINLSTQIQFRLLT